MAKIPNQSNLIKTIKSEVEALGSVVDVIVKASVSKTAKNGSKNIKEVNELKKTVDAIFAKDGILTSIFSAIDALESRKPISKRQMLTITNQMQCIGDFVDAISSAAGNMINASAVQSSIKPIAEICASIKSIFDNIGNIKVPKLLGIKLFFVNRGITKIINMAALLGANPALQAKLKLATVAVKSISEFTKLLAGIFTDIDSINLNIALIIKLRRLPRFIGRFRRTVTAVTALSAYILTSGAYVSIFVISLMFKMLENTFASIENIKLGMRTFMKMKLLPMFIRRINRVVLALNSVAQTIAMTNGLKDVLIVEILFKMLENTFASIDAMKLGIKALIKIWMLPKILRKINNVIFALNTVANLIKTTGAMKNITMLAILFLLLNSIFNSIDRMKVGMFITLKINRIGRAMRRIQSVIRAINRIRTSGRAIQKLIMIRLIFFQLSIVFLSVTLAGLAGVLAAPAMLIVWLAVKMLRFVIRAIARIRALRVSRKLISLALVFLQLTLLFMVIIMLAPIAMVATLAMLVIWGSLKVIKKVLRKLPNLAQNVKFGLRLMSLALVFLQLTLLFMVIILLAPFAIMAMPAMLLIVGSVKVIHWGIKFIAKALGKLANTTTMKGLGMIMIICGIMVGLGIMFLILATIAKPVVQQTLYILGLLGLILLVSAILIAVGVGLGLLSMYFTIVIAGLGSLLVVIGMLLAMAGMLRLIQMLNLDTDKIVENVKTTISTAIMVIDAIFRADDTNSEKSDKSWISSIIDFIGGSLKTVIQAIISVAFLAVMIVAILLILVIASTLRMIQELNLDQEKIIKNVNIVLDTAKMVIDVLFGGSSEKNKESDKNWLESLVEWIGGTYLMIIKAILAVYFLSIMVAAILMILVVAALLRMLQELDLKPDMIETNVHIVINTAKLVISALFGGSSEKNKESNQNWLVSLIESFASGIAMIINAIMAVYFLALAIGAILLIQVLALQLRLLQMIDLDGATIEYNITTTIASAKLAISSITNQKDQDDNKSNKNWIRSVIEFCGGGMILNIVDAIMAFAWLGFSIGVIFLVSVLAKQLETIATIDLPEDISDKVARIVKCTDQVVTIVTNRKDIVGKPDSKKTGLLKWLFPKLSEAAEAISMFKWISTSVSTIGMVGQLADILMTVHKMPDVAGIKEKVQLICNTADDIARMVIEHTSVDIEASNSRLKFLERINTIVEKLGSVAPDKIRKSKSALDSYTGLIDGINKMDVTKLETATKMFEHISEFSKSIRGDFEGLAKIFDEHIVKVLEEVRDNLKQTEDIVRKATSAIRSINASMKAVEKQQAVVSSDAIRTAIKQLKTTDEVLAFANLHNIKNIDEKDVVKWWKDNSKLDDSEKTIGDLYNLFTNTMNGQGAFVCTKSK